MCRTRCHLRFLRLCYDSNVIPKFLLFRLPRRDWQDERLVQSFRKRLLQLEIVKQEKLISHQLDVFNRTFPSISTIGLRLYISFRFALSICIPKEEVDLSRRHENKFRQLRSVAFVPDTFVIINLSNVNLTELLQCTLSLGLKYCITPSSVNLLKVKTEFEKLYCKLGFDKSNACNNFLVKKVLYNAHNFFTRQRLHILKPNLSGNQLKCLKDLSKTKDIVIMKPDKSVGVVILNSIDYK